MSTTTRQVRAGRSSRLSPLVLLFVALGFGPGAAQPSSAQPSPALHIVVIEGEDAVNVIQQRTAVAPVVEVRDRNDQPVAGAVVSFAVRAGRATFNGARTITVTTNAAGRAVAAGLTPTGSGALQISATATLQGETATVAIAQTNVLTAAQAVAASAAGGAGASGAGAGVAGAGSGAAAGGGLSATTIALAGAAVAGGAVAVAKVAGGHSSPAVTTYAGPYSAQYDRVFSNRAVPANSCSYTVSRAGTITLALNDTNGTIAADFDAEGTETIVATKCGPTGPSVGDRVANGYQFKVTGNAASLTGSLQRSTASSGGTFTDSATFSGSLSASVVSGTLTFTDRIDTPTEVGLGSATTAVTLR